MRSWMFLGRGVLGDCVVERLMSRRGEAVVKAPGRNFLPGVSPRPPAAPRLEELVVVLQDDEEPATPTPAPTWSTSRSISAPSSQISTKVQLIL